MEPWEKFAAPGATAAPPATAPAPPVVPAATPEEQGPWTQFTLNRPKPKEVSVGDVLEDMGRSVVGGLGKGTLALAGLGGEAQKAMLMAKDWITGAEPQTHEQLNERTQLPTAGEMIEGYEKTTGVPYYKPTTEAGRLADAAGQGVAGGALFTPLTAATSIGRMAQALANSVRYGAVPGAVSELAGSLTKGMDIEPWARLISGGVSGWAPSPGRKLITPFPITSPTQRHALDVLEREGITDITAGQKVGNKSLKYAESELGGGPMAELTERGSEQFTEAALRRAGIFNAPRATKEVIDGAFDDLGREFDDLTRNYHIDDTTTLANDVGAIIADHRRLGRPDAEINGLTAIGGDIAQAIDPITGTINGRAYQSLRSRIDRLARNASEPDYAMSLREVRSTLDQAMENAIGRMNPDDLGAFQTARHYYRNLLVIERAMSSGRGLAEHLITPEALNTATRMVFGRRNFVRGRDEFTELADAGSLVLKPMPQSGTAPRAAARGLFAAAAGGVGGAFDPQAILPAAAGGIALPMLAGRALTSKTGRDLIGNQLLGPGSTAMSGMAAALMQPWFQVSQQQQQQ